VDKPHNLASRRSWYSACSITQTSNFFLCAQTWQW